MFLDCNLHFNIQIYQKNYTDNDTTNNMELKRPHCIYYAADALINQFEK